MWKNYKRRLSECRPIGLLRFMPYKSTPNGEGHCNFSEINHSLFMINFCLFLFWYYQQYQFGNIEVSLIRAVTQIVYCCCRTQSRHYVTPPVNLFTDCYDQRYLDINFCTTVQKIFLKMYMIIFSNEMNRCYGLHKHKSKSVLFCSAFLHDL